MFYSIAIQEFAGDWGPLNMANEPYSCANDAKAKFDEIYDAPDPRGYYTTLFGLDYQIPTNAKPVFRNIMAAMKDRRLRKVVDVGCSYGVNAAMLRYDLTFEELAMRYGKEKSHRASVAKTIVTDAKIFSDLTPFDDLSYVGLDIAEQAAGYAEAVGLIDEALTDDLESKGMPERVAASIRDADLVISTGAIGYVGEETLGKIVGAAERQPWVAAFVLRQFSFEAIAERLAAYGLITEKLPDATFRQRRFRDDEEQAGAIEAVRAAGCDPEGMEADGYYHAEFFLARPAGEIAAPVVDMKLV